MSICSHWIVECSSQSKISQFDNSLFVNEKILRLQITVNYSSSMTEIERLKNQVYGPFTRKMKLPEAFGTCNFLIARHRYDFFDTFARQYIFWDPWIETQKPNKVSSRPLSRRSIWQYLDVQARGELISPSNWKKLSAIKSLNLIPLKSDQSYDSYLVLGMPSSSPSSLIFLSATSCLFGI